MRILARHEDTRKARLLRPGNAVFCTERTRLRDLSDLESQEFGHVQPVPEPSMYSLPGHGSHGTLSMVFVTVLASHVKNRQ